jgi:hypothetical protein
MSEKRIPDLIFEQYVLGELSEQKAREVEASNDFVERVAAVERDNASFAERYPAEAFAKRIANQYAATQGTNAQTRRTDGERARRTSVRRLAVIMPGVGAVLALAFVLIGGFGPNIDSDSVPGTGESAEIVRIKGLDPGITVYRSNPGQSEAPEELTDGAVARRGDRLQIAYNAGGAAYGAVVSLDGRGTVTLHYPLTSTQDPQLVPGGSQQLPYAYELDDAPAFERFFFITSDASFAVERLLERIRRQADALISAPDRPLQLPEEFSIQSITIRKGE